MLSDILKNKLSNALKIFLSVLTIAFCFFIPHYANLTIFVYPIVILFVVWLFLKYVFRETFADIFFSFKRFKIKAIWVGVIAAILLSLFFRFAWDPFINSILPSGKIDLSDFANIRNSPFNYAFILLLALLVGGFYEEIIFHGFIFTRLEKTFKGKWATSAAFILTTIIFGLYHFQQGIKGILLTAIAGAVYHALILKFNRNLWYGVFVHAFFDFIGLTLIYLGKLS
jgi:membrane protease YdiL (CAAX protease family)